MNREQQYLNNVKKAIVSRNWIDLNKHLCETFRCTNSNGNECILVVEPEEIGGAILKIHIRDKLLTIGQILDLSISDLSMIFYKHFIYGNYPKIQPNLSEIDKLYNFSTHLGNRCYNNKGIVVKYITNMSH